MKASLEQIKNREPGICVRCGELMEPAGRSNEIDGRVYHGDEDVHEANWIICPKCYRQDDRGNWHIDD